jgi:hypothetical protein
VSFFHTICNGRLCCQLKAFARHDLEDITHADFGAGAEYYLGRFPARPNVRFPCPPHVETSSSQRRVEPITG